MPLLMDTIHHLLQECAIRKDVTVARQVHSLMVSSEFASVTYIGDHLIRLFASSGSLLEANLVFCRIGKPSVYTWQAIITAHSLLGESERALQLVHQMEKQNVKPNEFILSSILKACCATAAWGQGRLTHDQIIRHGLESNVVLGSSLIAMYTKCGRLDESCRVFEMVSVQNVVLWGAMISAYAQHGQGLVGLELFGKLLQQGMKPDKVLFLCALKSCNSIRSIEQGRLIHSCIIMSGLELNVVVGSSIIDMYGKCGSLEDAHKVFDRLATRNVASWGALIAGYAQHGEGPASLELFESMQKDGIKPDIFIFSCILKACSTIGAIRQCRLIHEHMTRSGLEPDAVIGSTLVDLYAKCGSLDEAHEVFDRLQRQNIVSWNALIAGHAQHDQVLAALELSERMKQECIKPDKVTILLMLKLLSSVGVLEQGRLAHVKIIGDGSESDEFIGSALVSMYAKCGSLQDARKVFNVLHNRDGVLWAAMITGYAQHGENLSAFNLFKNMQEEDIEPNRVTLSCILKVCGTTKAMGHGRVIHDQIMARGFELDVIVGSALINMYAKCGSLEEAHKVLDKLQNRNVVSWNALISGYTQNDHFLLALELFDKMQRDGLKEDKVTFVSATRACGSIGTLELAKQVHDRILNSGVESDMVIGTALVDMYSRCGSLDAAWRVLDQLQTMNAESWNTLIAGYARHGKWSLAKQYFEEMQRQGLKAEERAYSSILGACSLVGRVKEGPHYFNSLTANHSTILSTEHFNGMVDLLCRAGCLLEAEEFLFTVSTPPDVTAWTSLLTACRTYGSVELGRKCFKEVVLTDPTCTSGYALMSNIYADAHLLENACQVWEMKRSFGAWLKPGRSWIQVNKVHEFSVGDETHLQRHEVYAKLRTLRSEMKKEGYIPGVDIMNISRPQFYNFCPA